MTYIVYDSVLIAHNVQANMNCSVGKLASDVVVARSTGADVAIQPQTGRVAVGRATAESELHVGGDFQLDGAFVGGVPPALRFGPVPLESGKAFQVLDGQALEDDGSGHVETAFFMPRAAKPVFVDLAGSVAGAGATVELLAAGSVVAQAALTLSSDAVPHARAALNAAALSSEDLVTVRVQMDQACVVRGTVQFA